MPQTALIVVDVQAGFDDPSWGPTTNPDAEANVGRLVEAWRRDGRGPVVVVRHDSVHPESPLNPANPGNRLKDVVAEVEPDVLVTKQVNSAFYGEPALDPWLRERGIDAVVVCGIQTNMCVETTARMAGNLGYEVTVPLDATRTFDLAADVPGTGSVVIPAAELMRSTAVNLAGGGFARVVATRDLLDG